MFCLSDFVFFVWICNFARRHWGSNLQPTPSFDFGDWLLHLDNLDLGQSNQWCPPSSFRFLKVFPIHITFSGQNCNNQSIACLLLHCISLLIFFPFPNVVWLPTLAFQCNIFRMMSLFLFSVHICCCSTKLGMVMLIGLPCAWIEISLPPFFWLTPFCSY